MKRQSRLILGIIAALAATHETACDDSPDRTTTTGAGTATASATGTGAGTTTGTGTAGGGPGSLTPVDWSTAGYPGEIPDVTENVTDVSSVGVACDGSTNDSAALQAAIDGAANPSVLLFPAATCRIESPLSLASGVVLRGRGSASTIIECSSTEGCLQLHGSPSGDYLAIVGGLLQGSTQLDLADASSLAVGDGVEIRQRDYVAPAADWGEYAVGQMAKVTAIAGTTITIDPPLHIELSAAHDPELRRIELVEQIGIEDLTIRRLDAGGSSESNVSIRRAADSWIRRIESDFTEKYHIGLSESVHVEIRDSYFHHAKSKGDGGLGYGASLSRLATAILVENNVFVETRHAMIVQIGTNGCVFGYNYAERCYSDDGWDKTYITLHGHYPFMNLFEGNVVGYIGVDDVWGPNGPGNTFLRNRVIGTDGHEEFGDRRGFLLEAYDGTQYLIGNEVGAEGIYGDLSDLVLHGNNVNGEILWDPTMPDQTVPVSYYLSAKPAFYGTTDWPSLGGDLTFGEGTNPARDRYLGGSPVPQP